MERKIDSNVLEPKASSAKLVCEKDLHEEFAANSGVLTEREFESSKSASNLQNLNPDDSCLNLEFIKTLIRLKESKGESINLSKNRLDFDLMSNINEINVDDSKSSIYGLIDEIESKKEKQVDNNYIINILEKRKEVINKVKTVQTRQFQKRSIDLRPKLDRVKKLKETAKKPEKKEEKPKRTKRRTSSKASKNNLHSFKEYMNGYLQRKKDNLEDKKASTARPKSLDAKNKVKVNLSLVERKKTTRGPATAVIDLDTPKQMPPKKSKSTIRLGAARSEAMKEKIKKYFKSNK